MTTIVHFEVYVYDNARGWLLQARYPGDERLEAVEEAKMLEFSLTRPVRVVRETYYPGSNASDESITYVGRLKPGQRPTTARRVMAGTGRDGRTYLPAWTIADDDGDTVSPTRPRSTADFAFRLVVVMILSLIIAVLGTGLLSMATARVFLSLGVDDHTQSLIMFLIFMGLFLVTSVPLVALHVPLDVLLRPKATGRLASPPPPVESSAKAAAEPSLPPADCLPKDSDLDGSEPPIAAAPSSPTETPEAAEDRPQEPPAASDTLAGSDDPVGEPPDSPALDASRLVMMKFLGGAVATIKTLRPQLDTYNRFGMNLYLAGACEALAEARQLSREERCVLVREAVEVIGTRADHAQQLIDRLDSYKRQGRYRQMVASGKVAMEVHLAGSSDPFIAMGGILKDWNTPHSQQVAATAVTILFTDMVGSTDMTQVLGDAAAQDVIRAHNHIVRAALVRFAGKEVKHTGDGIMASFDSADAAIQAAMDIQCRAAEHTGRWPTQALALRIGMNTGDPIVEENDYFGATVQLAARLCDGADTGQIWLSAATHDSLGEAVREHVFHRGSLPMKGVQGDTEVYEVAWNDARRDILQAMAPHDEAGEGATTDDTGPNDRATDDRATDDRATEDRATGDGPGAKTEEGAAPAPSPPETLTETGPPAKPSPAPKPAPPLTLTAAARPKPDLSRLPPRPPPRKQG
jgi:adenylate cyclase